MSSRAECCSLSRADPSCIRIALVTGAEHDATPEARRAALLVAYDHQLREDAEVSFASRVERDGPLLRAVYDDGFGFVSYRALPGYEGAHDGDRLDALIDRTIRYFDRATDVSGFEWKTRSHDQPFDLGLRLLAHGLIPEAAESVMVGETQLLSADVALPHDVSLRRVGFDAEGRRCSTAQIRADIAQVLSVQQAAFGVAGHTTVDSLMTKVVDHAETVQLWMATATDSSTDEEIVVGTGRLELVPGTQFAGIWGGATLPAWRSRGIYRALTAVRAKAALSNGIRYLQSDCTEYSKPILERSGFVQVTSTTPYIWTRSG